MTTTNQTVYYRFTTLVEHGSWDHLNSYSVEGDYGTTINKELIKRIHNEGKLDYQELKEALWVERTNELGEVLEKVEVYDWFN